MRAVRIKILISLYVMATIFIMVACFCAKNSVLANDIEFTIYAKDSVYKLSGKELSYYKGRYYINCLDGVVDKIYYDTLIAPIDAELEFCPEKQNPFEFKSEVLGLGVDRAKLIDEINLALINGTNKAVATFTQIEPKVKLKNLKNFTYKRAEFSTEYPNSQNGRKQNIKLATSKINGLELKPNEEFSFNKVVGKRTEQNGFTYAPVIENGEFTEGVGGGVCQVSTTLYNCALLSGLNVTKRYAHSLVPSYIEPSFDAMVSGEVFDLKFVNQTAGSVYIKGQASGKTLTFTIYGEKQEEKYERVSKVIETISPPEAEVVEDEVLPKGQTEWVRISKDGIKSQGFLVVEKNCGQSKIIKLHTDVYKFVRGLIKVGVNEIDKEYEIG